jgi:hypothetical protein
LPRRRSITPTKAPLYRLIKERGQSNPLPLADSDGDGTICPSRSGPRRSARVEIALSGMLDRPRRSIQPRNVRCHRQMLRSSESGIRAAKRRIPSFSAASRVFYMRIKGCAGSGGLNIARPGHPELTASRASTQRRVRPTVGATADNDRLSSQGHRQSDQARHRRADDILPHRTRIQNERSAGTSAATPHRAAAPSGQSGAAADVASLGASLRRRVDNQTGHGRLQPGEPPPAPTRRPPPVANAPLSRDTNGQGSRPPPTQASHRRVPRPGTTATPTPTATPARPTVRTPGTPFADPLSGRAPTAKG